MIEQLISRMGSQTAFNQNFLTQTIQNEEAPRKDDSLVMSPVPPKKDVVVCLPEI